MVEKEIIKETAMNVRACSLHISECIASFPPISHVISTTCKFMCSMTDMHSTASRCAHECMGGEEVIVFFFSFFGWGGGAGGGEARIPPLQKGQPNSIKKSKIVKTPPPPRPPSLPLGILEPPQKVYPTRPPLI